MLLPTKKVAPTTVNPKKMIIFGKPKIGKSTALAELEDSIILDLEGGSDYLNAVKIDVIKTAKEEGKTPLNLLYEITQAIVAQGKPYKRVIVDTVTALEDIVLPYALQLYQQTPMGRTYQGDILALPNGGGYLYTRTAIFNALEWIYACADEVILIGHLKDTLILKDGKEVSAKELDLTGKTKSLLSAKVDAIGLMYRKENKCMLSFVTSDEVVCGSRPEHLKNRELVLTEMVDGAIISHWDEVFLPQ
jgi:hypothetical protein